MCQLRLSSLFQFALAPKIHTKCKIIESCNSIEILISYVLYSNLYPQSVLPNLYMTYVNKLFIWHTNLLMIHSLWQIPGIIWILVYMIQLSLAKRSRKKSRPTAQLRRTELSCLSKLHMSYSHMHDPMYENEVKFYRTHICISDTVYILEK